MKKILAALGALTLSTAVAIPATAKPSISLIISTDREHRGYYDYDRRYRQDMRRYYSRQPSYYPGRCYPARHVVVRDYYTGRLICVDKRDYRRMVRQYNRY